MTSFRYLSLVESPAQHADQAFRPGGPRRDDDEAGVDGLAGSSAACYRRDARQSAHSGRQVIE
jgi:hypothetical protein